MRDSSLVRFAIGILFWVSVFGIVREWLHSKKHGVAITFAEKGYLASTIPLFLALAYVLEMFVGFPTEVAAPISIVVLALALSAWPIKRRIQRTSVRGSTPDSRSPARPMH